MCVNGAFEDTFSHVSKKVVGFFRNILASQRWGGAYNSALVCFDMFHLDPPPDRWPDASQRNLELIQALRGWDTVDIALAELAHSPLNGIGYMTQ